MLVCKRRSELDAYSLEAFFLVLLAVDFSTISVVILVFFFLFLVFATSFATPDLQLDAAISFLLVRRGFFFDFVEV